MEQFEIAHLKIQGVDVIIAFVDSRIERASAQQQHATQAHLQACARSAGLAGNVVLVWHDGAERMKFFAPQQQHPFFRSVSYNYLYQLVNRTLSCG